MVREIADPGRNFARVAITANLLTAVPTTLFFTASAVNHGFHPGLLSPLDSSCFSANIFSIAVFQSLWSIGNVVLASNFQRKAGLRRQEVLGEGHINALDLDTITSRRMNIGFSVSMGSAVAGLFANLVLSRS